MTSSNENIKNTNKITHDISVKVNNKSFQNTDNNPMGSAMIIADSGYERLSTHSYQESAKNEDLFTRIAGKFTVLFPSGIFKEKDLKKLSYTFKVNPGSGLKAVSVSPFQSWRWENAPGGGNHHEIINMSNGNSLFSGSFNDMGSASMLFPGNAFYFEQFPGDLQIGVLTETFTTMDYGGYVVGYENITVAQTFDPNSASMEWTFAGADYKYGSVSGTRRTLTYFRNITACSSEFIEGYGYRIITDKKPGQQQNTYRHPNDYIGYRVVGYENTEEASQASWEMFFSSVIVYLEGFDYVYSAEWGNFHWDDPDPDPENGRILSGPIPFYDEGRTMPIFNGDGSINPPVPFTVDIDAFNDDTGAGSSSAQDHYDETVVDMPTFDFIIQITKNGNEIEKNKFINYLVKSQHSSCFINKTNDEYNMVINFEIYFASRNSKRIIVERTTTVTTFDGPDYTTLSLPLSNADRFIASDNHAHVKVEILYHDTQDLKSLEPYA